MYGCGGVGLLVVMIVSVVGVNVIVVDLDFVKLVFVKELGVVVVIDGKGDVVEVIKEIIKGGVYVLLDVFGYFVIMINLILCLCLCGKYI